VSTRPRRWKARELLELVLDPRSFISWDQPIEVTAHADDYQQTLRDARTSAEVDESVLTGRGTVSGRPVAVIVNEFGFLGGSIGAAAAARITSATRRATAERLPLVASTASGGTRMQEGTPAFLTMVDICRAIVAHRSAGLPYLVHLRHPTTGGVYASWGSLGHFTVAEPGALIGFLGPKVYQGLTGAPFPRDVQTAEHLAECGVIDAIVETEDLSEVLDRALRVMFDRPTAPGPAVLTPPELNAVDAWSAVENTRRTDRIGVRDLLRLTGRDTLRLRATEGVERDGTVLVALTRLSGQSCILVGQDRSSQSVERPMGPAALRTARRAMSLAQELALPLVTVIDTPGAELSTDAEERAIGGEIARCIAAMCTMTVPTVSVLLGQGTGGGALALMPARETIALENAWLAPLPPEGASLIVYGDTEHAAEMARQQHITSTDLQDAGAVHRVVAEQPGVSREELARAIASEIGSALRRQLDDSEVRAGAAHGTDLGSGTATRSRDNYSTASSGATIPSL
jgi:acyl-CoA carboxylase subunit beta